MIILSEVLQAPGNWCKVIKPPPNAEVLFLKDKLLSYVSGNNVKWNRPNANTNDRVWRNNDFIRRMG